MAVTDYIATTIGNSTAASESVAEQNAASFRYFGISVALFAIFVGSSGNMLTILSFASNKKLRTTFNIFVVNLSIVDFITSTLMLPFNLAGYVQMQWPFGNNSVSARVQAFSYFCCGYTSVVFLVAITINRFIGVFWPAKYEHLFRRSGMIIVLVFCWTFAPVCLFPFLVGTDSSCQNVNKALTGYNQAQFLCTFICLPMDVWNPYMQFTRVTFQFLPLVIMIVTYSAIFLRLRFNAKKMERVKSIGMRSSSIVGSPSVSNYTPRQSISSSRLGSVRSSKQRMLSKRSSSNADMKRIQNNRRMLLISFVICIAFMITFLPSFIINLIPGRREFDTRVHMAASNLTWFNSSLNPIVYVILNPRYRREYIRLIRLAFGRAKGRFVHYSSSFSTPNHGAMPVNSTAPDSQQKKSPKIVKNKPYLH